MATIFYKGPVEGKLEALMCTGPLSSQAAPVPEDKPGAGLNNAIWKWQCDKQSESQNFSISKAPWSTCFGSDPVPACPVGSC